MNPNGWKEIGRQMDGKKKLPMRPMCTIVLGAALHSLLLLVYVICYAMNWIKLLLLYIHAVYPLQISEYCIIYIKGG